jgi:hypothetical protein
MEMLLTWIVILICVCGSGHTGHFLQQQQNKTKTNKQTNTSRMLEYTSA